MLLADSPRSSAFTYESRTHCLSVLGRLDEQRHRDLLCDITVAVDGQSFRAHRAVLSACSEYFAGAVSKYARHGAVLSLPPEVTAAGFEPLLRFAYSSKLHFGKHDVLEVRTAASVLGFRDLDRTCFDFLLPKFFNSGRSSAPFARKTCCKKKWRKRQSKESDSLPSDVGEKEGKPASDSSSDQEAGWPDSQPGATETAAKKSPTTPTRGTDEQRKETNDYFLGCPKYRKFLACCTDRAPDNPAGALPGHSTGGSEDQRESVAESPGKIAAMRGGGGSVKDPVEKRPPAGLQEPAESRVKDELLAGAGGDAETKGNPGAGGRGEPQAPGAGWDVAVDARWCSGPTALLRDGSQGRADCSEAGTAPGQRSAGLISLHPLPGRSHGEDSPGTGRAGPAQAFVTEVEGAHENRGTVPPVDRRLKAEGECFAEEEEACAAPCQAGFLGAAGRPTEEGPSPGLPPLPSPGGSHHPSAGSPSPDRSGPLVHCPFLRDLGAAQSECRAAEGPGGLPPCVSPLNSTEEMDSETETEGEDPLALEKARQVQLPFSLDWIVNLSKNDFQQLLKRQTLNLEQQEFVHDMRRRSKNRMAAQRCRKRKLECIYNLECEINKLRTEKQRMLAERSRLQQLKVKSWHTVSALCDKICSEASLMPEQLQVLAKYTTADCPFVSLIPCMDATLSGPAAPPRAQASLSACASDLDVNEAYPLCSSNPSGDMFRGEGQSLEDAPSP